MSISSYDTDGNNNTAASSAFPSGSYVSDTMPSKTVLSSSRASVLINGLLLITSAVPPLSSTLVVTEVACDGLHVFPTVKTMDISTCAWVTEGSVAPGTQLRVRLHVDSRVFFLGVVTSDSDAPLCSSFLVDGVYPSVFKLEVCCVPKGASPSHFTVEEESLVQQTFEIFTDPYVNGHKGSLPMGIVQSRLRDAVLGEFATFGVFREFVEGHPEVFSMIEQPRSGDKRLTIREYSFNAAEVDDRRAEELAELEAKFIEQFTERLQQGEMEHQEILRYLFSNDNFTPFLVPSIPILIRFLQRFPDIFHLQWDWHHGTLVTLKEPAAAKRDSNVIITD
eukprot:PhM_4_TR9073/c0_g2_i1/m.56401